MCLSYNFKCPKKNKGMRISTHPLSYLFINQEDARNLREVGKLALPFLDGLGLDIFALARDVGCNAELRGGATILHDVLHHLVVAVRSLDEELRLVFGIDASFQGLDALDALARLDGQIAMEGKALSIEARTHHRKNDGRRTYQGNYLQVLALGNGHHIGTRVGHGRASRFGDDTHRLASLQRLQVAGDVLGRGMLVQGIERELVDVDAPLHLLQEPACRTHILDNEMLDAEDDFLVVCREYLFDSGITQGHGDEI